jgi:hypothetical protein
MFSLNYGLLLVFGIALYIMIIDQNVADYFLLVFNSKLEIKIESVFVQKESSFYIKGFRFGFMFKEMVN